MNQFTETSHQGYFSRVIKSFTGVLFGLLMIPGSVMLLGWNEYRTVHRSRGIDEAEKVFAPVASPDSLAAEMNDKLIHLQGKATTDETLTDPDFHFKETALRLKREVEFYEWVEHKHSQRRKKLGGGTETTTTYDYDKKWTKQHHESSKFHHPEGHSNPLPRYQGHELTAERVMLGAHRLSDNLVAGINAWKDGHVDAQLLSMLPEEVQKLARLEENRVYIAHQPAVTPEQGGEAQATSRSPEVGDLRVGFRYVEPCVVSVLAAQRNGKLEAFQTSNGELIESIQVGEVSAAEMFRSLRESNALFAWIFRGVGFVVSVIGFSLILGPLATLASFIPFLEDLTGFATFIVSIALAAIVSLATIGVAWFAVRPLLSGGLFAVAIVCLFFLFWRRSKPLPDVIHNPTIIP